MIDKPLIILAGGFGSRLQSVLKGAPKPLADINGVPFLYLLIQNWIEKGFNDFIFSLYFEATSIIDFIEKNREGLLRDCRIRYVVEPSPLGTGGAISYLLKSVEVGESFFVVNADTWVKDGYSVINTYDGNVIGILEVQDTSRYGSVIIDNDDVIKEFKEKDDSNSSGNINAGVYKLSKSIFMDWDGNPYSLENNLFPCLVSNRQLKGILISTEFVDIGIPEDYYKFCKIKKDLK